MQWPDMLKDVVLLVLGGVGTAIWFFLRRRAEQAPVFENIQKAEELLSLRKELDSTNYTVADLKNLEDTLMGRAKVAKELSITYEQEAQLVREIELNTGMTQAEMNIAAAEAYRKAERKLDTVIAQMREFFLPEECVRFEQSNEAWRAWWNLRQSSTS
ncbi:MAG: DUF1311 domain-containing protein [bacterium]|nr:DUF1311 domain-containing protein [bacterium]